jgi:hypothetical protein
MLRFRRTLCVAFATAALRLPPDAAAGTAERLAVQRLLDAQAGAPEVTTAPATGAIVALRAAAIPLADGRIRPGAAACEWLQANAEAFGLRAGEDELRLERDERLPDGGHRVLVRQCWNGIPVESGDARCIVSATGELRFVAAGFLSALAAPTSPRVARAAAVAIAAAHVSVRMPPAPVEAELWVRRRDGRDRVAWAVRFPLANGLAPRVWVDAGSGDVLDTESGCVNAVGLVYPDDPRGPLAELPLMHLETDQALVSSQFAIQDQEYVQAVPLGPGGDFRYPPSHASFDQVNVYWHVQHFLDFMSGLGYAGPPESLVVRVNMALEPNVAITDGRYISYGRPIPGFVQDVARCQDILYHEVTHAVIYGFGVLPTGPHREAAALHEGLADYFSCALTGDPVVGEWLYLTFPNGCTRLDQPAPPWDYDHFDQVGFGGGLVSSAWGNGMILSSGLWDLRQGIGASADSLVLESLAELPTTPIWSQFANAVLQADQDHHGGRFASAIVAAFGRRHIRGAATAAITGPSSLAPGAEAEFAAAPCCGGLVGSNHWRVREWCRGAPCEDWRDAGDGARLQIAFDLDAELELTVRTPWGDTLTASRFVGVRPPELDVEGPRRVPQREPATWRARVVAMGPASVRWTRQSRRPRSAPEPLGSGAEQSFAPDTSLDLVATLTDGLGRTAAQHLAVETFVDHPPPLSTGVLRMSQSLDAGARHAETRFELTRATPLKLSVYDVRGRLRVTLWDGPATRGTHAVRWDASGLEPGVYFLRLLAEPSGLLERFVVLR